MVGVLLTVLVVVVPPFRSVFDTAPLNGTEWGISIAVAFAVVPLVELYKLIVRAVTKHREKLAVVTASPAEASSEDKANG